MRWGSFAICTQLLTLLHQRYCSRLFSTPTEEVFHLDVAATPDLSAFTQRDGYETRLSNQNGHRFFSHRHQGFCSPFYLCRPVGAGQRHGVTARKAVGGSSICTKRSPLEMFSISVCFNFSVLRLGREHLLSLLSITEPYFSLHKRFNSELI